MSETVFLFIAAAIAIGMIPLVPRMVCLKIRLLRFLRLRWFADLHERYSKGIVTAMRVIIGGIAVVLLILGFEGV